MGLIVVISDEYKYAKKCSKLKLDRKCLDLLRGSEGASRGEVRKDEGMCGE